MPATTAKCSRRRSSDSRRMTDRIYTAGLVVIGDEILSGRTHDRNIAQVASWLQVQGIRLAEVRVVPDVTREDRRRGERAARRERLSVHHRRNRPDARRYHRGRRGRGARRAGGRPSRGARDPGAFTIPARAGSMKGGCGWRASRKARS